MDLDLSFSIDPATEYISWHSLRSRYVTLKLSFLTINARSLTSKFNEIQARLSNLKEKITFIVITATHLNETRDNGLELPGYYSINFYRNSNNLGGGIKFYYLDYISVNRVADLNSLSCESLILRVDIPGFRKVNVCAIYRPPHANYQDFHNFLETIFEFFEDQGVVMLGDININVLDGENIQTLQYNCLLESYGYKNEIYLPTHVNQSTNLDGSCLDHIVHNLQIDADSFVLTPNISDQYAVAALFPIDIVYKPIKIKFRDFSQTNIIRFQNNMELEFSRFDLRVLDIDEHTHYIIEFLRKMLNKYFPIKNKTISQKRLHTPWITKKIRKCIKKKHQWYCMAKQKIITHDSCKQICKKLRDLLNVAKSEYFTNKLHSLRNNNNKNWAILNRLLGKKQKIISDRFNINGTISSDPQQIASEFNHFFVDHPLNIQQNIPSSSIDFSDLVSHNPISANFEPCSSDEVPVEIGNILKTGGIHDISGKFLKLCRLPVSVILSNLYNRCLSEGKYPTALKLANVTPVFKKGSRTEISNHRPISVLPNLSKIFESIIYKRIQFFSKITV